MSDILDEEFEVLESIYPTELTKLSERDLQIDVEPEDLEHGAETLKLTLSVRYTEDYPNVLPTLSLEAADGDLEDHERDALLDELRNVGDENLGMAMTFTLVSHLRDQLATLLRTRAERQHQEEMERERLALAEEDARTRGTPVSVASFKAWKLKFDQELAAKRAKEEEDKLRGLTPKEREEWKRMATRLSGRQLFERNKNLEEDSLMEDGTVSVDVSQYERVRDDGEEDEDDHVTFSDSD